MRRIGQEILFKKSLGAIRQSTSQGGTREQGDLYGQRGGRRMLFHSTAAKLLYLSKRARSDIIAVVGFLCTRVKGPRIKDWEKLSKLWAMSKVQKVMLDNNIKDALAE